MVHIGSFETKLQEKYTLFPQKVIFHHNNAPGQILVVVVTKLMEIGCQFEMPTALAIPNTFTLLSSLTILCIVPNDF
uniref:Uncharacterized protein n=1 Tax=Lepeophtheirus salmonis TaxID=72036 RepID=A0A0K2UGX1_LEPSM